MKKYLLLILLLVGGMAAKAQNIQIHYDFGSALYENDLAGKPKLTTTVEMFKADKWGSTYFFVDMDYNLGEGTAKKGISCAYWEISRELRFWEGPLSAHVEYNGGVTNTCSLENCYLVGPTYTHNSADFSRGFTFSAMYKYIQHCAIFNGRPNNFQLTGTWYLNFARGKGTFTGFADWWKQDNAHGKFIFLSEPQIWLNLNKFKHVDDAFKLSIGSEWELSDNFSGRDGFYCCPTLAVKWTFN